MGSLYHGLQASCIAKHESASMCQLLAVLYCIAVVQSASLVWLARAVVRRVVGAAVLAHRRVAVA